MIDIDDIDRAVEFLAKSSDEAAQCRADRLHLDDFSKSLMSKIMNEYMDESLGAQERNARSDERYLDHLQALKMARYKDEKLKFLREAAQAKIEVWRSQLSWAKTQESVR